MSESLYSHNLRVLYEHLQNDSEILQWYSTAILQKAYENRLRLISIEHTAMFKATKRNGESSSVISRQEELASTSLVPLKQLYWTRNGTQVRTNKLMAELIELVKLKSPLSI